MDRYGGGVLAGVIAIIRTFRCGRRRDLWTAPAFGHRAPYYYRNRSIETASRDDVPYMPCRNVTGTAAAGAAAAERLAVLVEHVRACAVRTQQQCLVPR